MADVLSVSPQALINEFLTEKGKEVIKKMFVNFQTAQAVTRFEGLEESLVMAQMDIVDDLIYEYTNTTNFSRTDGAIEITGPTLNKTDMKVELKAVVNDQHMKAFRAYLKGAGMTMDDMNFVEYLIQNSITKMESELEDGVWQAVTDTTPGNIGNRKLIARFDGYRKIAKDAGTAGNATVVATGAVTSANAVDKVEQFYRAASKPMKQMGFNIYCSYTLFEDYLIHYRSLNSGREAGLEDVKRAQYSFTGIPLMLSGGKTYLVPVPGFGDDDALIGTRPEFLAYGYSAEKEYGTWDIQKHGWEHWMLNFFPIGVQILLKKPGFLLVNDQL